MEPTVKAILGLSLINLVVFTVIFGSIAFWIDKKYKARTKSMEEELRRRLAGNLHQMYDWCTFTAKNIRQYAPELEPFVKQLDVAAKGMFKDLANLELYSTGVKIENDK